LVELSDFADQRFQTYSTGMRQRLSIARALIHQPRLMFLDEPAKGLDYPSTIRLHTLLREKLTRSLGITVFLTTHDLEEAQKLCDRIAIMDKGSILACGNLSELRQVLDLNDHYQVRINTLPPEIWKTIQTNYPSAQVNPAEINTLNHPEYVIDWVASSSPEKSAPMDPLIDLLRQVKISILGVNHIQPSLEMIFQKFIENRNLGKVPAQIENNQDKFRSTPDGPLTPPKPFAPPAKVLAVAMAFFKRDFASEVSYRFAFLLQFVGIFFSVGVFYFVSKLLGNAAAPYLAPYGGSYFAFVLIGIAFSGYFGVGLSSFANSLRQAQTTGTLEILLATPVRLPIIILASSQWEYFRTTFQVLVYLILGAGFLGVSLEKSNYLAAGLILILTIITFSSLGIMAASFIMVIKRGDPVTWVFSAFANLLGGVYYPVSILPGWMQSIAKLIPVTYSLEAMRLALLQGASFNVLFPNIIALAGFSIILLPISLFAFRYAVQRARVEGSLTHY
jgi:ABC-2 type transport system permease protein